MEPHVAILMGTLNGAAYLPAQLASFVSQSHGNWSLHVSDDGSTDTTGDILTAFQAAHPQRCILLGSGPGQGSAANYFSLLERGGGPETSWPEESWVALSDQDDVWMQDRIAHAIDTLTPLGPGPAVYASRTVITDMALHPIGPSRLHPRQPEFGNALTQNILAGNTIVMNPASVAVARRTAAEARAKGVAHHDWWLYMLLAGVGARIVNDDRPGLYYRQHDSNQLGASRGFGKARDRFAMIWDGRYGTWMRHNVAALRAVEDELTKANRKTLQAFDTWLSGPGRGPLAGGLARVGAWRQTGAGTAMLRLAACAGRL